MPTHRNQLLFGLTLALLAGQALAHQNGDGMHGQGAKVWEDDDDNHDRARRASEGGEILTMPEILKRIRSQTPGRVLDTELEREDGRWIYEIKLLDAKGRLYEVEIDAHNGEILRKWEGE
jgi:uncharacterized membrane protein YkoI